MYSGIHIPVVSYETFKNNPPDYAVLFAWNHAEEIMAKEKEFMLLGVSGLSTSRSEGNLITLT